MSSKNNVKLAALIVMTGIFLSRILGYVRDMLIASTFGMGMETDVFNAAFIIPDFMFQLLIGGTLSTAFIPVFTTYLVKGEEEEGWKLASNFINIIALLILVFTMLGIIFAPYIVPMVVDTNKFTDIKLLMTIKLTRIVFSTVAFTSLAGILIGIHNAYQSFVISAIGPIVYNVGVIITLLVLGNKYGIEGIAYGVIVSALCNFVILIIGLWKKLGLYRLILDPRQEGFHQIIKLAIPTIIGLSISYLNLPITLRVASSLGEGSITALKYANTVMWLPIGIFATGIATAIFPTLTRLATTGAFEDYKETFSLGIRTIMFISIPASIGLIVLREPIIRLLYLSGKFNVNAVQLTAFALLYYSIGIAFLSAIQLINRGFYSIKDTVTPVIVGFASILINVILNIIFIKFTTLEIGGLALASSLSAIFNTLVLSVLFQRKIRGIYAKRVIKSIFLTSVASVCMGFAIIISTQYIHFNAKIKIGQVYEVAVLITIGIAVFSTLVLIFKMEEAHYFISMFKNKLKIAENTNK